MTTVTGERRFRYRGEYVEMFQRSWCDSLTRCLRGGPLFMLNVFVWKRRITTDLHSGIFCKSGYKMCLFTFCLPLDP